MLNLTNILIGVPITLIALTGHELAHAWVSTKLGDPTPRREGRLTLNPLAHLDLVGTILMIFTGFGWAKPVGVNPMYYKDRKKGMALTAIAGPCANFIMAFLGVLIGTALIILGSVLGWSQGVLSLINFIFYLFAFRNLCFMVFNLIPIPPLDGSKVLGIFLPNRTYYTMLQYERYAIILIMLLSVSGAFDLIIGTGVNAFYSVIENVVSMLVSLIV
ncbi:MAG: site-2 protease family protein [Ruminococcaceae bacterium]|nr:site-2 protease family protein [Oscillospiraceae bacterium]